MKEVRETGKEQLWPVRASPRQTMQSVPHPQQTKLFRFLTLFPFFSVGERELVWQGEEMSTSFKNLSASFCPVSPEGELCLNLTMPKEVT